MPIGPRAEDVPRIRGTLTAYRVSAAITGVFLLLLVVMMVTRYGFGADLHLGGPAGFLTLTPKELIEVQGGVNLSTVILIVHGWLYVAYLLCDFALWRLTRYSFLYFLFVALGGVVPFLSFYFEWRVPRDIRARVAALEAIEPANAGAVA